MVTKPYLEEGRWLFKATFLLQKACFVFHVAVELRGCALPLESQTCEQSVRDASFPPGSAPCPCCAGVAWPDELSLLFQRSIVLFPRSRCRTGVRTTCLQATTWSPFTSLRPLRTNQRCSAVRTYRILLSFLQAVYISPRSKI